MKYSLIFQLAFLFVLLPNHVYSQNIIGGEPEYCINSPVDTIYGINPTTGTFAAFDSQSLATGVTQISWNPAIALFDPSKAYLHGDHAHIVYNGIEDDWQPKIKDNAPNGSLDPLPALFCDTDPPHVLSGGTPVGGFYLLDGV
ncbi:MAG: hypothetical protein MUO54_04625, partial [Anaerolineales bacterium]|nr:hypothetical protein [Anaerolineales bacterium]